MPAGDAMDALIARAVYDLDTGTYEDALGESLYIVDRYATRRGPGLTSATVIGCSWITARNEAGEVVEFYGRLCPMWSTGHDAVWDLIQLKNIVVRPSLLTGRWVAAQVDRVGADGSVVIAHGSETTADTVHLAVCRAILKTVKPRLEEVGTTGR